MWVGRRGGKARHGNHGIMLQLAERVLITHKQGLAEGQPQRSCFCPSPHCSGAAAEPTMSFRVAAHFKLDYLLTCLLIHLPAASPSPLALPPSVLKMPRERPVTPCDSLWSPGCMVAVGSEGIRAHSLSGPSVCTREPSFRLHNNKLGEHTHLLSFPMSQAACPLHPLLQWDPLETFQGRRAPAKCADGCQSHYVYLL